MRRCWTRWRRVEGRGDKFLICLHCDQFWLWNKKSGLKQTHTALRAETYQDINTWASSVCCFGVSRWACESNTVIFESTSCIQIGAVCISVGGRLLCEADKSPHDTYTSWLSERLQSYCSHQQPICVRRAWRGASCLTQTPASMTYARKKPESWRFLWSSKGNPSIVSEQLQLLSHCLSIRLNKTGLSLSTLIWTVPI